jgi:hypothetical protein
VYLFGIAFEHYTQKKKVLQLISMDAIPSVGPEFEITAHLLHWTLDVFQNQLRNSLNAPTLKLLRIKSSDPKGKLTHYVHIPETSHHDKDKEDKVKLHVGGSAEMTWTVDNQETTATFSVEVRLILLS